MKPLRCLTICFNSCWSCPGGRLQVQPHLGIVPQEWLRGGCDGSTLEKQESRPVHVSCCRRDIVSLIKIFIFLFFLVVFILHDSQLCCMPPVKTVYEDHFIFDHVTSSQDAESVEKVDTVVGVHYNCCQSQQLLQLPMQKLFFAAERLRDMQLRWQSASGAICRRCRRDCKSSFLGLFCTLT